MYFFFTQLDLYVYSCTYVHTYIFVCVSKYFVYMYTYIYTYKPKWKIVSYLRHFVIHPHLFQPNRYFHCSLSSLTPTYIWILYIFQGLKFNLLWDAFSKYSVNSLSSEHIAIIVSVALRHCKMHLWGIYLLVLVCFLDMCI